MRYWKCAVAALLLAPCAAAFSTASTASANQATVTRQNLYCDGTPRNISAYNIDGSNYFMLRDVAHLLNDSTARFSIDTRADDQSILVTTGERYQARGDETPVVSRTVSDVTPSDWKLVVDGETASVPSYCIGGFHAYKLRDLSNAIGFDVGYEAAQNCVQITTVFSADVEESAAVAPDWFDDAVFVGDSVSSWLSAYSGEAGLGNAVFLTATSFGIENALGPVTASSTHPSFQGEKMKVEDAVAKCGARKVYIMFGLNDIDYGVETATTDYVRLVQNILEKSPNAQIYIESVTPLLRDSKRADDTFNNTMIRQFNETMKQHCQDNGWYYMDIASVYADVDGNLREEVCNDPATMGLHITYEATSEWVDYLRTHTGSKGSVNS